jgi:hypothetical protein
MGDVGESELSLAKNSVNQVLALSSGILGLSLTLVTGSSSPHHRHLWLLQAAWVLFGVSLIAGVVTLSAITGVVGAGGTSTRPLLLRIPWLTELCAFVIGLALFTVFGILTV